MIDLILKLLDTLFVIFLILPVSALLRALKRLPGSDQFIIQFTDLILNGKLAKRRILHIRPADISISDKLLVDRIKSGTTKEITLVIKKTHRQLSQISSDKGQIIKRLIYGDQMIGKQI